MLGFELSQLSFESTTNNSLQLGQVFDHSKVFRAFFRLDTNLIGSASPEASFKMNFLNVIEVIMINLLMI